MALFIASLNSGSNGNCYYIGNKEEAVLVDVGISCRETERRMGRLGLNMRKVKAILVSHEHTDHIKGIPVLAKKYNLPVYITSATLHRSRMELRSIRLFASNEIFSIGSLKINTFSKLHDASDPHSFNISFEDITVGVFTDIGSVCENLSRHFQKCNAAFLESNYDEQLLQNGGYPFFLKKRISGGNGHLSNREALALFKNYRPACMSHLILSHLSKDNNCPRLVKQLFDPYANGTEIIVASRFEESAVFEIKNNTLSAIREKGHTQLSLF